MSAQKTAEQFKKDMSIARGYVSAELAKHDIMVDVRLLTTISVMTSVAMKFIDGSIDGTEARESFDKAIDMYRNNNGTNLPF